MEFLNYYAYGDAGWGDELLSGFAVTVRLAVTTLPVGMAIGFAVALSSLSPNPVLRRLGTGYSTAMRGIPELLTLFAVYNGVALVLNAIAKALNPDASFVELSPFVAGVVSLSLVFGAFSGEVLRGGFQALDSGQIEAGRAIGMSPGLIFTRIKLPQIWRFALPGLGNLWINLVKDTALVSIIALNDLMRMANIAVGATKKPFTFFFAVCLIYWLVCFLSELAVARMERRANRGVRRA